MNWPVLDPQSSLYSAVPPTLYQPLPGSESEEETPLLKGCESPKDQGGGREGMHPTCSDPFAQLCPSKLHNFLTVHHNHTLLSPLTLPWKHQLLFIHLASHMSLHKSYMVEGAAFLVTRRNIGDYEKKLCNSTKTFNK